MLGRRHILSAFNYAIVRRLLPTRATAEPDMLPIAVNFVVEGMVN